jgi:tetratricopeptide (TPR) repeat protein
LREYEDRFEIDPKRPFQLQEYQDRTLYTTWDISYSQLQKEDPIAAKLLKLLAYFDNQSLWYELFSAGFNSDSPEWLREVIADDLSFTSVMSRLTEYCFIEVQMATESWSMHNCIHDWTLAMLNKDLDGPQLWYAFDCVAASITDDDWDYELGRLIYNRLAAHATRLVRVGFQGGTSMDHIPPDRLGVAQRVAQLLRLQTRFQAAEQLFQHVLAGREQELGPTHIETLRTFNNVGVLYYDQGKLEQAEEYYLRALGGKEQTLGPALELTLDTVHNLGTLYSDRGKLEQAEKYYLRALTGCEQELGPTHPSTLETVNNLGLLYKHQGNLVHAEEYYLRALTGQEQALGPTHPSTLDTVNNLGGLYHEQGKLAQAEEMYRRALAGDEKNFLIKTIRTLNTIYNLGLLFRDQGKAEEAREMFHRALSGRQEVLGPDHFETLFIARLLEELELGKEMEEKRVETSDGDHRSTAKRKRVAEEQLLPLGSSKTRHNTHSGEETVAIRSEIAQLWPMPT